MMVILKNKFGGFSRMDEEFAKLAIESGDYEPATEEDAAALEHIIESDLSGEDKAEAINEYSSK